MIDFDRYEALTFDCYGTLVDWEGGMLGALKPLLTKYNIELDYDTILELFAEFEAELEQGEHKKYRQVLEQVVQKFGERFGFSPSEAEKSALPDSIKHWQPFPDTVEALKTLKQKYKLVILSNIDDDLFADTAQKLQIPFDDVITAEQVQSYKPSLNNFKMMMQRVGLPTEKILHVGASIYHDVIPASSLGLSTVFVDRRHDGSAGAAKAAEGKADLQVPDLKTLAMLATQQ